MNAIIFLAALVVLVLFFGSEKKTSAPVCPPGYAPSPVNSTWAGWTYNCLPVGVDSSLVGVPSNTNVPPLTTMYAPIVNGTQSSMKGMPAKTLEFPSQDLQSLFPRYK